MGNDTAPECVYVLLDHKGRPTGTRFDDGVPTAVRYLRADLCGALEREVERLREEVAAWQSWANTSRCIYCGEEFTHDALDQDGLDEVKKAHVLICKAHPCAALRARVQELEATLEACKGEFARMQREREKEIADDAQASINRNAVYEDEIAQFRARVQELEGLRAGWQEYVFGDGGIHYGGVKSKGLRGIVVQPNPKGPRPTGEEYPENIGKDAKTLTESGVVILFRSQDMAEALIECIRAALREGEGEP